MTDTAPPAIPASRVHNYVNIAYSTATNGRRTVSTNRINNVAGDDYEDLATKNAIARPIASGCLRLWLHNPQGAGIDNDGTPEVYRYHQGNAKSTGMLFRQRLLAEASGLAWLHTGFAEFIAAKTAEGIDLTLYFGRPKTKDNTTLSPWLWPADISDANMASLPYIRSCLEQPLANGCGGLAFDATGIDHEVNEATGRGDTSSLLFPMLRDAGTYSGSDFGTSHTGSFTNGHRRRVYAEAVPLRASGAWMAGLYSWCARYATFEAAEANPTKYLTTAESAYRPIVFYAAATGADAQGSLKAQRATLYTKALARLEDDPAVDVAVPFDLMEADGLDMDALLDAGRTNNNAGPTGTAIAAQGTVIGVPLSGTGWEHEDGVWSLN